MAQIRRAEQMESKSSGNAGGDSSRGWYTQQAIKVIQGLHKEVDDDALESLQIMCQELSLDANTVSRLLQTRNLGELLRILLEYNNNNLPQLFVYLERFMPKIIHDMRPEVRDKLLWLSETAAQQNTLIEENIHGREETIDKLMSLLAFREDNSTKLVNVCGMPGIGKSFLVKHLRNRLMNTNVFYVDASGVTNVEDLKFEIVVQSRILNYVPEKNNIMDIFSRFLQQNKEDQFVLILDDLSGMMDVNRSCGSVKLLDFLHNFMLEIQRCQLQLKVLVTSQHHLEMLSEEDEQPLLVPLKRKLADYTKDVPLSPLPLEDAVKFLGPSMQSLSDHDRMNLVEHCRGHPLALHLMSELAITDFTHTTEVTHVSPEDLEKKVDTLILGLFEKAFNKLSDENPENIKILCSVALFDVGAPLRALHHMVNAKTSFSVFFDRVKKDFSQSFWLRLLTFPRQQYTALTLHHPFVGKFLHEKMAESQQIVDLKVELQKRFIGYYVGKLIRIGKDCIPEPPHKPDYVSKVCLEFLQDRPNFKRMFTFVYEFNDPSFLFSAHVASPISIAYFFVSIWQFNGWLEEPLMRTLENLCSESKQNVELSALVQTLYGMILAVTKQWDELGEFLGPHNSPANRKRLITFSHQLYFFCEAVHSFTNLVFFAKKSIQKKVDADSLIKKWESASKSAQKYISRLPSDWKLVKGYFSALVLMETAEAKFCLNPLNSVTLEEVFRLCERAKEKLTDGHILECKVYGKLAEYKKSQGAACEKGEITESGGVTISVAYSEAAICFKRVCELLKHRKMDTGLEAAKNYSDYGNLLRNWGFSMVQREDSSEEASRMFELAERLGTKAVDIYENRFMRSSGDLLTAYIYHGMTYRHLYKYHHLIPPGYEVPKWLHNYKTSAVRFYGLAYGLLNSDSHKCGLAANDWRVCKLLKQLPKMMELLRHEKESCDEVKANLQEILRHTQESAHKPLNLSGSEVDVSSEDDDSLSSSDTDGEVNIGSFRVAASAGSESDIGHAEPDETDEREAKKTKR